MADNNRDLNNPDETASEIKREVQEQIERERQQYESKENAEGSTGCRWNHEELLKILKSGQDGDKHIFIEINRERFCYDHAAKVWYEWQDHYWIEDEVDEALASIDTVIEVYMTEARHWGWLKMLAVRKGQNKEATICQENETAFLKRVSSLQNLRYKRDVLTLSTVGKMSLGIDGRELDLDPWLLGCKNGVIDLKTGNMRPGQQSDYIRMVSPVEYQNINCPAPIFEKFMIDILNGNAELVAYVQRLLGYGIVGKVVEHLLAIFWGKGRNGKTTLVEILADVLGPLAGPIQSEFLLDQARLRSSAGPSPDIMRLRGLRIAWASETGEGRKLDAGRVKQLVGGDTLIGRSPYSRREVSWNPTHIVLLLTNHRPRCNSGDYALWQRLHLIPFQTCFVNSPTEPHERQCDIHLLNKLKLEGPGILAWLVRGCLAWQKEGLKPPDIVRTATEAYREEEDFIGQFINERCVTEPHCMVQAGKLRKEYETWCEELGLKPVSGNAFSKRLLEDFDRDDSRRNRYYLGIGLKVDE